VIAAIDWEWQIIPDILSLGLLVVGLVASPFNPFLGSEPLHRFLQSTIGALTGFLFMEALALVGKRFFKKEALGGGDIKLVAALGAFLGWEGVFFTLFLGSLSGTLVAVVLLLLKRLSWGSYIPFGPFLALGGWIAWLK
jgi:leader peptidase (prepilin peptidase)/N-methyltransferase